ncbi:MAG: sulfite exporter TauE/SafE family protein [Phycisphaerales bacterium]|nr:sulfite exporter TauE/SafE family protein [Phycisphaerales bacterium]MCB9863841.1 sulfite exporter TauE/SafE family protein [Phycisphaerales bacterium]
MTPFVVMTAIFLVSIGAGMLGSVLGLGGGIIVVPALSLWLGVDIRYAIGASIVSVIATSSGAGAAYVKDQMVNLRLGMFLELATTTGALSGAFLAGRLTGKWLEVAFGLALIYTAYAMWRHNYGAERVDHRPDRLADALRLNGVYHNHATGEQVSYRVYRTGAGFALSGIAGIMSGLLGIGGGVIKVPAMSVYMRVPLKVAAATSTFMIGVTAAASAGVYFARGDIDPYVAGPTAIGVVCGSLIGSRQMRRLNSAALRAAFTIVLIVVAVQMLHRGLTS